MAADDKVEIYHQKLPSFANISLDSSTEEALVQTAKKLSIPNSSIRRIKTAAAVGELIKRNGGVRVGRYFVFDATLMAKSDLLMTNRLLKDKELSPDSRAELLISRTKTLAIYMKGGNDLIRSAQYDGPDETGIPPGGPKVAAPGQPTMPTAAIQAQPGSTVNVYNGHKKHGDNGAEEA